MKIKLIVASILLMLVPFFSFAQTLHANPPQGNDNQKKYGWKQMHGHWHGQKTNWRAEGANKWMQGGSAQSDGEYRANLTLDQVTHQLYQPGAKDAPMPFYKKRCSVEKAKPYDAATGQGVFWFNAKDNTLRFAIVYAGLSGDLLMAHIHYSGSDEAGGPIVQTLCGKPTPSDPNPKIGVSGPAVVGNNCPKGTSGFLVGSYKLEGNEQLLPKKDRMNVQQEIKYLNEGDLYVNLHTCLNEQGELRGAIRPLRYDRFHSRWD